MKHIPLLTSEQEMQVLQLIVDQKGECLGAGASRVCYLIDTQLLNACGLNLDSDAPNYVIKVAIGLAGVNQSHIESNTYRHHYDYPLAPIYYLGHYVEIMETVSPIDGPRDCYSDSYDEFVTDMVDNWDYQENVAADIFSAVDALTELNGYTSDNGQVGYDRHNNVVAYDYGFDPDSDERLISDLSTWIDFDNGEETDYFSALIQLIRDEDTAIEELENRLLGRKHYDAAHGDASLIISDSETIDWEVIDEDSSAE